VNENIYLVGTKTQTAFDKGNEPECIDRYIRNDAVENKDFKVCSGEMWEFLSSRYGYDLIVRRYYQKQK